MLGSALFAYIVGAISTVVHTGTAQDKKLKQKMVQLHEYLNLRKIPSELARLIRMQCLHKWRNSVFSEEDILDDFMPQTRREVVEHILGEVVNSVAMFKYIDHTDYLADITLKFRPVSTGALQAVQHYGDPGPDLFVVSAPVCCEGDALL